MTKPTALAAATTCKIAAAADKLAAAKTYRLGSNEMVSAPGMVRWAINGASFKSDIPQMVKVIESWGVPKAAAHALVTKKVPFTVEGETVVFTA